MGKMKKALLCAGGVVPGARPHSPGQLRARRHPARSLDNYRGRDPTAFTPIVITVRPQHKYNYSKGAT